MELNWFESIIFGLVSGLAELLPVSAPAHEALLSKLLGINGTPFIRLLVHISVWFALYFNLRDTVARIFKERSIARIPFRRRTRQPDPVLIRDMKLLRTAVIVMTACYFAAEIFLDIQAELSIVAVLLVVNGVILYIPGHLPSGNKDARSMTPMDGVLLGLSAAASYFPGISRIGMVVSTSAYRGAGKDQALRWALLLELIAMLIVIGFDAYSLISVGFGTLGFSTLISCALACAAAFGGATAGMRIMEFLAFHTGFSGFAYYSWGAALFAFLMYLTI